MQLPLLMSSLTVVILFLIIFFKRNSFVLGCAEFSVLHTRFCLVGLRGGYSLLGVCRLVIAVAFLGAQHGL